MFDRETNTTGKLAKICQLSVCDISGSHRFSEYVLPTNDIVFLFVSRVNNLEIRLIKGERKLFKNKILIPSIPFGEALTKLVSNWSATLKVERTYYFQIAGPETI